jgi:hypothetical protein
MKNIILTGIYTQKQTVMGTNLTPNNSANCANKQKQMQTDCPHSFFKLINFFNQSVAHQAKHRNIRTPHTGINRTTGL